MVIDDLQYFGNLKHSLLNGEDKTLRMNQIQRILAGPAPRKGMAATKAQTKKLLHFPNHSDLLDAQMDSSSHGVAVLAGGRSCVGAHQLQLAGSYSICMNLPYRLI